MALASPPSGSQGWLSPEGTFYPLYPLSRHCDWCLNKNEQTEACQGNHNDCLQQRFGWAMLKESQWIITQPHKITPRQVDYIFDWLVENNQDPDRFFEKLLDRFLPPPPPPPPKTQRPFAPPPPPPQD